jgi:hypothetical protein
MGAQLARLAYAWAVDRTVKPNEMRLLVFMALTALDADNPPRYFASRESSAVALGRRLPERVEESDPTFSSVEKERDAAFSRVKVATQGLVKSGAIRNVKRGREGQRAEYALTFQSSLLPGDK